MTSSKIAGLTRSARTRVLVTPHTRTSCRSTGIVVVSKLNCYGNPQESIILPQRKSSQQRQCSVRQFQWPRGRQVGGASWQTDECNEPLCKMTVQTHDNNFVSSCQPVPIDRVLGEHLRVCSHPPILFVAIRPTVCLSQRHHVTEHCLGDDPELFQFASLL